MGFWKKVLKKVCQHKWKVLGHMILRKKYPRVVQVCEKCGVAIHIPIYTIRQLTKLEEED